MAHQHDMDSTTGGPTVLSPIIFMAGVGSHPRPRIARLMAGFAIAGHHIGHVPVLLLGEVLQDLQDLPFGAMVFGML